MPFSMKKLLFDLTGKDPEPSPVFDPPKLTPSAKTYFGIQDWIVRQLRRSIAGRSGLG